MATIHQTPMAIPGKMLHFPGPQVTWAGEFPWTHGLCFGMEDGSLGVRDINGVDIWSRPMVESGEAINGVAFSRDLAAISTRAELLLVMRSSTSGEFQRIFLDPIGAHSVVSTGRGGFVAPTGASGVMQIELLPDGSLQSRQFRVGDADLYFYRIARLGTTAEGNEILACAARNDGVISLEIGSDGLPKRVISNQCHTPIDNELADIVDVCRLRSATHPFAMASLGIDNSIHLTEDIRRAHRRLSLRSPQMQGTAYSLLSAQGHLFILTSENLYLLPKLADRFLEGEQVEAMTVRKIALEALDCFIAYGEHLMLITAKSVLLMAVSQLATGRGVETSEMVPERDQFTWEAPKDYPVESLINSVPSSIAPASVSVG